MIHRVGRVALIVLGWVLVALGLFALVLPGPGLLLLLAGLVVLANEYAWARARVEPVKRRAFEVAEQSVKAWWRIMVTFVGGLFLVAVGVLWGLDPQIPRIWVFGPQLPAGGWATGVGLIVSGIAVWALLGYSVVRFGNRTTKL